MRRWAMSALLVSAWLPSLARADLPHLAATRTAEPIRIDGRLSERAWQAAFDAAPFITLGTGEAPTQATVAHVLYDEGYLYFGFECEEDKREAMAAPTRERDGLTYLDDCVEVFVAPGADSGRYYHFVVNAGGAVRDELRQDETWNSSAVAAACPTRTGWSVELAVPLADLEIRASAGTDWRVNLCREERPHGELSSWAPTQQGFHEPERFGWLTGLEIDVARYAREGVLQRARQADAELRPALGRARAALPLAAARAAVDQGAAAQDALARAIALAMPAKATVADLEQAEASLERGLASLQAMRAMLPRMDLSLALKRQGVPTEYAVCEESSMARIRPDGPYAGQPARALGLALATREYEATQVVIVPVETDLKDVRLAVSDLKAGFGKLLPASQITVNRIGCVNVTQPSARSGAERGLYPDPLLANAPVDISRDAMAAWLITVYARSGQPAGEYLGRVTVNVGNAPDRELPLNVKVWGFELPRTPALRTCFQLLPSYVYKYSDFVPGPGVPVGWEFGVWTGADIEGRPDYFGTGVFHSRFATDRPHSGRRALCIEGEVAEPGANEAPRACYHRAFPVTPGTDYALTVWYRTENLADGKAQVHVHTHNVHQALPAAAEWTQSRLSFNSGDRKEARIYLGNYGVGKVYFDDLSLAPVAQSDVNVVDDPSFERGRPYEERAGILQAYRLNSLQHRCSDMNIASPTVEVAGDGQVTIDWTAFDREIEFYVEHGLNAFNVPWGRVPGGWGRVDASSEPALRVSAEILRQTQQHLEAKGWLDLAYLYTIDEPGKDAFPDVQAAFDHVHRAAPKLKRLLTFGYGASRPIQPGNPLYRRLEGYVDIWVPHSDCFEPEYLETRRRAGDEIWEYVCISAQKPYANIWGIDFPGTDPRVVFWQCYAEEITGFLYWATDYWEKDPWHDPLTYPGGNGDGSLLYYGPQGPVNSLRWETIRDGIEDYDYLVMLEQLVRRAGQTGRDGELYRRARAALDVSPVTRSYTDYTTSPTVILDRRAEVAQWIERLARE